MKWVFDWKCSLYSLTVCLDSMSPFPPFFIIYFALLLQSHSASVVFLYTSGLLDKINKKTHTNSSPIPLQLGSLERRRTSTMGVGRGVSNDKLAFLRMIPTVLVEETTCSLRWETGNMQKFPLGLYRRAAQRYCNTSLAGCFILFAVPACSFLFMLALRPTCCVRAR